MEINKTRQTGMNTLFSGEPVPKIPVYVHKIPEHVRKARYNELIQGKGWRSGSTKKKVKALRRKLSALRAKPVPDAGVVYERTNPNGSIRKYKVQPNGEWRRVD